MMNEDFSNAIVDFFGGIPEDRIVATARYFYERGKDNRNNKIKSIAAKLTEHANKCMEESEKDNDQGAFTFWDGFNDCAIAIQREMEG